MCVSGGGDSLLGHIDGGRRQRLLLVDEVEDVLLGVTEALLEVTDVRCGGLTARNLVRGIRGRRSLVNEKNWGTSLGGLGNN